MDDFIVTSSIFHETRNGGEEVWTKKGDFSPKNPPIYSLKKTLDPLLSYKVVIISNKLEIMNLTQPTSHLFAQCH